MNKLGVFQELGIPSAYPHHIAMNYPQILRYQAWMAWSSVSRTSRLAPWMPWMEGLDKWAFSVNVMTSGGLLKRNAEHQ